MLEECRDERVNILKCNSISILWCANGLMLLFKICDCSLLCRLTTINYVISAILKDGNPFTISTLMFASSISGQGTPEQQETWLQRALNHKILGTYAQVGANVVTELN